jgi:hypothetical protein
MKILHYTMRSVSSFTWPPSCGWGPRLSAPFYITTGTRYVMHLLIFVLRIKTTYAILYCWIEKNLLYSLKGKSTSPFEEALDPYTDTHERRRIRNPAYPLIICYGPNSQEHR